MRSCLQEVLLTATGRGVVAGGGPNPCGALPGNDYFEREVLTNVYQRRQRVLGQIVRNAKDSIIRRYPVGDANFGPAVLYTIFGDPALRLKYPLAGIGDEKTGSATNRRISIAPNPFSRAVCIKFPLSGAPAGLDIYDESGRLVRQFNRSAIHLSSPSGGEQVVWDGKDDGGRLLPDGVYFMRLREERAPHKLIIIRRL